MNVSQVLDTPNLAQINFFKLEGEGQWKKTPCIIKSHDESVLEDVFRWNIVFKYVLQLR